MKYAIVVIMSAAVWTALAAFSLAGEKAVEKGGRKVKTYAAVFDFKTITNRKGDTRYGRQLADSIRLGLRRNGQVEVIDRLTMQEVSEPLGLDTPAEKVRRMMIDKIGVNLAVYGSVQKTGDTVRAEVRCIDLRNPKKPVTWTKVFSDGTQRARGVIARSIVEAVTGKKQWRPPEYGDEPEPKTFGKPLNVNGSFDRGAVGWDSPDNVSTFLEPGPRGRGTILRVRTDLKRDPWLAYRRALRMGKADPAKPPKIARDTGYGSVAGLEGVHFRSGWIKAKAGQRYWLVVDMKGKMSGSFAPKVFVKGFRRMPAGIDGLPESSLAELGLTPKQFARLPAGKQRKLIDADAKKHPMRHVRECYRWYLACRNEQGGWAHFAAPVPPRGGLPKDVQFLQIQIYSYWPPGEYLWDNCFLYADPKQKAPLPEEKPRTPNFKRRKKWNERQIREKTASRPSGT